MKVCIGIDTFSLSLHDADFEGPGMMKKTSKSECVYRSQVFLHLHTSHPSKVRTWQLSILLLQ